MNSIGIVNTKCYELKTYHVIPNQMTEFLELVKSSVGSIKNENVKLLGYWKTDLGNESQVISLWEYSSLDYRMEFDKEWKLKYQSKLVELIEKQTSLVLKEYDWAPFKEITSNQIEECQVWELRVYTVQPDKFRQFPIDFQKGFVERKKLSEPVGIFYSEIGSLNTIVHLWPYKNFEERFRVRGEAMRNPTWSHMVSVVVPYLDFMENKTLIPIKL